MFPSFEEEIHKFPFIRFLFFLVIGILICNSFHLPISILNFLTIAVFSAILISIFLKKRLKKPSHLLVIDALIYSFIMLSGMILVSQVNLHYNNQLNTDLNQGYLIGRINSDISIREKTIKTELEILAIRDKNSWEEATGKTMAYFEKDSLAAKLKPGVVILIKSVFSPIEGPKNPEEFDYKKYLAYHLIAQRSYIRPKSWIKVEEKSSNRLTHYALNWREQILQIFKKHDIKNEEFAVLSALTLGYKNELDASLRKSYAASGAMHILAVSGLHMGIIYLLLSYLLYFIPKKGLSGFIRLLILLSGLWGYSMLTGISPSVFRASLMFSIVAIGNSLNRNTSIYNSLAASAFILLIINPYYLMEVGFQLSYLAVIGIVFFQPKIAAVLNPKNKILKYFWELMAVSLAAQITTAPISIYYFHQFPNYFLLTNIIVIPLAFIIVFLTIVFLVFSFWPALTGIIASFLELTVRLLNDSTQFIENLPFALSENIYFNQTQTILLYLIILAFSMHILTRKYKYFIAVISLVVIVIGFKSIQKIESDIQQYFIVYNLKNYSTYNLINGTENIMLSDLSNDSSRINYHLKNHWIKLGLENEQLFSLEDLKKNENEHKIQQQLKQHDIFLDNGFLIFENKSILFPALLQDKFSLATKWQLDYIVISKHDEKNLDWIINNFNFKQIILDSNIYGDQLKRIEAELSQLGLPYYSVNKSGAYVLPISSFKI